VILAGDVGATKILLEAGDFRSARWQPTLARRYLIADFPNFYAVISAFLAEWERVKPARARITAAAVGIAGPVQGNKVKMTHRAWVIDGDTIARRFRIPTARVVNDLAAAARGIDVVSNRDMVTIQPGKPAADAPRAVLGVGTGLGVAYLVPDGDGGFDVIPGEGGHMGFSPITPAQAELWKGLAATHGRVEAEEIVSGMGLANIYEVLRRRGDCPVGAPERAEPAWISQSAAERKDPLCINAMDLFAECLGNVAGDHALAVMARGGVFLAGGVIAKIAPTLNVERFRAAFCAKGVFSAQLMKIPVRVVTNERLALIGAARVAELS
jgi:glucokinase